MTEMLLKDKPPYKLFRGVFPAWDNTARREKGPVAIINSSPKKYAFWLSQLLRQTMDGFRAGERLVFINAWNEWAEGCHLEPDQENGLSYLQATRTALAMSQIYDRTEHVNIEGFADQLIYSLDGSSDLLLKTYSRLNSVMDENAQLRNELVALTQKTEAILNSQSWKITAPLRHLSDWIAGANKGGKN